jgi:BNR repeat-like domain
MPVLLHVGQVTRQDIGSQPGSEPDTVVEPDVAVSPVDKNIAIAAAHDSRFHDGGAVDISVAWTGDGGAHWQHAAVRGITTATGGPYDRASDPVLAFGADGTAYLSVLVFDVTCPTAVAVLRSKDGGRTWGSPHYAHRSTSCNYSDDKNWIVVDNSPASPHFGRVYQFWTPFLYNGDTYLSSPQALRWSDDKGNTWSKTTYVSPVDHGTQNSQPMIRPDGSIVDTFYDFGAGQRGPDAVPGVKPFTAQPSVGRNAAALASIDAEGTVMATTSGDGGATWSGETEVANNAGGYAPGVRCCLFAADIDALTQRMYVVWEGGVGNTDPVYESYSTDGEQWSSPVRVSTGDVDGVQRVNVDVVARGGTVYVGYGTRTNRQDSGGVVQQQLSVSTDRGMSFNAPMSIGPVSVLQYAARSRGYFPGDYIGEAITSGRLYMVWAVSSTPPFATSKFHQVIFGATLRP